jgi:hypothetical protein
MALEDKSVDDTTMGQHRTSKMRSTRRSDYLALPALRRGRFFLGNDGQNQPRWLEP